MQFKQCLMILGMHRDDVYTQYKGKRHVTKNIINDRKKLSRKYSPDEWRKKVKQLFRAKVKEVHDDGELLTQVVFARDRAMRIITNSEVYI